MSQLLFSWSPSNFQVTPKIFGRKNQGFSIRFPHFVLGNVAPTGKREYLPGGTVEIFSDITCLGILKKQIKK